MRLRVFLQRSLPKKGLPKMPSPTFAQNVQALRALFAPPAGTSPVPGLDQIAQAQIQVASSTLQALSAEALAGYNAVLAAHPEIYNSPQTTSLTTWQALLAAAAVEFGLSQKQAELTAFVTAEGQWVANNQGSLTPGPQPAFPPDLTPAALATLSGS